MYQKYKGHQKYKGKKEIRAVKNSSFFKMSYYVHNTSVVVVSKYIDILFYLKNC